MKSLKGTQTEKNILTAFAGESQARNRYTFFSSQAKKDGYVEMMKVFEEIAGRYPNVQVGDGFRLVPHLPEYFRDNLHPNELGAEVYGRNLVDEIRRIGF